MHIESKCSIASPSLKLPPKSYKRVLFIITKMYHFAEYFFTFFGLGELRRIPLCINCAA